MDKRRKPVVTFIYLALLLCFSATGHAKPGFIQRCWNYFKDIKEPVTGTSNNPYATHNNPNPVKSDTLSLLYAGKKVSARKGILELLSKDSSGIQIRVFSLLSDMNLGAKNDPLQQVMKTAIPNIEIRPSVGGTQQGSNFFPDHYDVELSFPESSKVQERATTIDELIKFLEGKLP